MSRCQDIYKLDWAGEEKKEDTIYGHIVQRRKIKCFIAKNVTTDIWIRAELNAAFVQMMSNKCKFMIFTLDSTELPELLQPYKYENINKNDLEAASMIIVEKILQQKGAPVR